MPKTILVSAHSPFIPILKSLAAEGHTLVSIQPPFAKTLLDLDIPARAMAEFSDPDIQGQAFGEAAKLLKTVKPPTNSLGPGALDFMKSGLPGFLYPRLADLASLFLLLNKLKPDLILVHNDVEPLNRTMALWAREKSVPCIHVPHAVYLDIEKGQPGDDIHDLITASHLAVGGWFQSRWYEQRGQAQIIETGLPQFDKMATLPKDPHTARRQLGLTMDRPVVTYASSWRQDTNLLGCHDGPQETYLAVLEAIRRLPDIQFVIKLHPHSQDGQWHLEMAQKAGVQCAITALHLESVLLASDAILTYSGSNLLLEASFIPWLRLMATQGYEDDPEVMKVSTDPPDPALITAAISRTLQSLPPNTAAFQAKYIGRADGQAAARVTEVVRGLL